MKSQPNYKTSKKIVMSISLSRIVLLSLADSFWNNLYRYIVTAIFLKTLFLASKYISVDFSISIFLRNLTIYLCLYNIRRGSESHSRQCTYCILVIRLVTAYLFENFIHSFLTRSHLFGCFLLWFIVILNIKLVESLLYYDLLLLFIN